MCACTLGGSIAKYETQGRWIKDTGREKRLTDSCSPPACPIDQERGEDDGHGADDDVSDVAAGAIGADAKDAALGVDTDGCGCGICGSVLEESGIMVGDLGGGSGMRHARRGWD